MSALSPPLPDDRSGYNQPVMKRETANHGRPDWRRRTGRIIGIVALGLHLLAASAAAQTRANLPNEDGGILQWGIAVGVIVVIALTGFLKSKRSHLT